MMTVKQIERNWVGKLYERLFRDLVACRPEAAMTFESEGDWIAPSAAMALIRMDELMQSHVPLYRQLIRVLLSVQQADGSWGDPAATALCLRALLCGNGDGVAIQRGMDFLARLQKPEGLWPKFPLRRMPEDALVSAFVILELGDQPVFQSTIRLEDAIGWFKSNERFVGSAERDVWKSAVRRTRTPARMLALSWS